MLLRLIYDETLAQAAYLIGCQKTGEAIVFDPERDVDRYIEAARANGLRIVAVAETHIHADFVSGARELAERVGAKVYVSGEGGADWKYGWLEKATHAQAPTAQSGGRWHGYANQVLRDGDVFRVGGIEFRAMHTPGHTPEHLCYLVTDRGGGAAEAMGIISGDFVFVGDLGRPDLLETAAGQAGTKEAGAHSLYSSVKKFVGLPEYLQVWPAHGAGSACGKALGAVPQTTVGYEKRFNPAIRAAASEGEFVSGILAGQPEPPLYFARMKRVNRDGPVVMGSLPKARRMGTEEIASLDGRKTAIVDTRGWAAFKGGHLAGALWMPLDAGFPGVAGSYIREDEGMVLVAEEGRVEDVVRALVRIGLDRVEGFVTPEQLEEFARGGGRMEKTAEVDVTGAKDAMASGMRVLDVRRGDEFHAGHIAGAMNAVHTRLPERVGGLARDGRMLVNCRSGVRSGRACAYLQREGFDVVNLAGGIQAWEQAGAPVER